MTTFLLDVNVLIALADPAHVQHDQVHDWFARVGCKRFATCPVTENGLLRIVGHPRYPNSPGAPSAVTPTLRALRALPGYEFWADTISIADASLIDASLLSSHAQVTDSYLLALAQARGGRLATMDRKLVVDAVVQGRKSLELI
ncbi:MAG: TA system VapC family ribonuclease toxin [Burkholderiaceae bacterium]